MHNAELRGCIGAQTRTNLKETDKERGDPGVVPGSAKKTGQANYYAFRFNIGFPFFFVSVYLCRKF